MAAEASERLGARRVMHREKTYQVFIDADESLGGVSNNWGQANDEGDEGDRDRARSSPHRD